MRLIIINEYTGERENTYINYEGDLSKILPMEDVDMCFVNGIKTDFEQKELMIDNSARITLHMKPPAGGAIVAFVISIIVSAVISKVLSLVTAALFSKKAKKPRLAQLQSQRRGVSRLEESPTYAFEGIQDTIAAGSPIPFVLGKARKGGQIISTRVELIDDGKNQKLFMLMVMSHGEIDSISDVELNGSKITNFPGTSFDFRRGSTSQTVMTGFENSVDQTYFDGREFTDASIIYTTKTNVDRVDLFVGALGGIFHNNDQGDFLTNTSRYKVEYRPQTSAGEPWILDRNDSIVGRTTNQKFKIHTVVFTTKDTYEIRLTWVSASFTDESQDGWDLSLHNIVEKVNETRTYNNYTLLGISAVSTAQLNGRLPNVTAVIKGQARDINNIFIFTENNAWNIREVLRNTTWGLGHRLPNSFFETTTWQALADYCDATEDGFGGSADQEPRHTISYVGDTKIKGWDLVKSLLSIVDSSLIFSEGKLKVIIDKIQSAAQLYSDANTVKGSLVISQGRAERRINTVNGRYFNADEGYKLDFTKVEDTASLATESVKNEDIDLIGVSRQSESIRVAGRHLRENIFRKKEYSWKSPPDAIVSEPGDLIKRQFFVSNFEKGYSGYILDGNTKEVYLDTIVTLDAGKTYEIFIRHKTKNTFVQEDIVNAAGDWGKIVLLNDLSLNANEQDLYAIGEKNVALADVLLEEVNQGSDGTFVLKGVNYDINVYSVEALPSKITRKRVPIGDISPLPIENWTVREGTEVLPDGSIGSILEFDILPGMLKNSGTSLGATVSTIDLSVNEPNRLNFFLNAKIQIVNGTGTGQVRTILAYDGLLRRIISLDSNWSTVPDTTSEYEIDFIKMGEYHGSIVEFSEDQVDWFELGRIIGIVGSLPIRAQGTQVYLRLIPFTVSGKRNEVALLINSIATTGSDILPSDVSSFSVVQINVVLLFTWMNVSDLDIDVYEIRQGNSWEQSLFVGESKQNFFETTEFVAGTKTFWIKAKDRTGNFSTNAASFIIILDTPNPRQLFSTTDELASLAGTFDGLVARDLATSYGNGISLVAKNKWDTSFFWDTALSAVSATQAVEVWDGATFLTGTYVTQIFNLGAIAFARIFADIGFQDSEGVIFTIEEQHSDDDIIYSSWRLIGAGDIKWKFARLRITLTVTSDLDDPVINKFNVVIDALVRIFRGNSVSVPTGAGTTITFPTSYINTPNIDITEHDQAPIVFIDSPSKSGFTLKHDGGGTSIVNWRSEGI